MKMKFLKNFCTQKLDNNQFIFLVILFFLICPSSSRAGFGFWELAVESSRTLSKILIEEQLQTRLMKKQIELLEAIKNSSYQKH